MACSKDYFKGCLNKKFGLWHVQRIDLGDVWIKNMVYGMFKGLI